MGADIYLKSVSDKARAVWEPKLAAAAKIRDEADARGDKAGAEKAQAEVSEAYDAMFSDEGYYRDSYNRTSLFYFVGLSWWNDVKLNKKSCLSLREAKKLRNRLAEADISLATVAPYHKEHGLQDTVLDWVKYLKEKRERLIKMLDRSIELKEPLYCSV